MLGWRWCAAVAVVAVLCLRSTAGAATEAEASAGGAAAGRVTPVASALWPIAFEPNLGQADPAVRAVGRGAGVTVLVTDQAAVLVVGAGPSRTVLRLVLAGGRAGGRVELREPLPGRISYLVGRDPSRWVRGLPTYREARLPEAFPGVDLVFHGRGGRLEYDFVVRPGTDPSVIALEIDGPEPVADAEGRLSFAFPGGTLTMHAPAVYQEIAGVRRPVIGGYVVTRGRLAFVVGPHDPAAALVIDPVLTYSTLLGGGTGSGPGGTGHDAALAVAVDAAGHAYVAGLTTQSSNFPVAGTPPQPHNAGGDDAFVAKLAPDGSTLVWATLLGGSHNDTAIGVGLDGAGNVLLAGTTTSTDFPTVHGFQPASGGDEDGWVAKLDPTGSSLLYASYLGGTGRDTVRGFAVAPDGHAYVLGETRSADFPIAGTPFQPLPGGPSRDGFVTKVDPSGATLVYSTYFGGAGEWGFVRALALDGAGHVYITGTSVSPAFPPTTPGVVQPLHAGHPDVFVTKLSPDGSSLVYSTYVGGALGGETGLGIAVDAGGHAYVVGSTDSADFPVAGALQPVRPGGIDGFVAKLSPSAGALVYSTYLGGTGVDYPMSVVVDAAGHAHVMGNTTSSDFPVADPVQAAPAGGVDLFVAKLAPSGAALVYSTYLGGSGDESPLGDGNTLRGLALDPAGNLYVAGQTFSGDFPTVHPLQGALLGPSDAFVLKLGDTLTVDIDIKPGSFPNSINLGSGGSVPVAIFGSATFDAAAIVPGSVTLASAPVQLKGKGRPMATLEDVDGDGYLDLVVHVDTSALQLGDSDTEAVLEGSLASGRRIRGTDSVRVVP
jgi:hypothetical protein